MSRQLLLPLASMPAGVAAVLDALLCIPLVWGCAKTTAVDFGGWLLPQCARGLSIGAATNGLRSAAAMDALLHVLVALLHLASRAAPYCCGAGMKLRMGL